MWQTDLSFQKWTESVQRFLDDILVTEPQSSTTTAANNTSASDATDLITTSTGNGTNSEETKEQNTVRDDYE